MFTLPFLTYRWLLPLFLICFLLVTTSISFAQQTIIITDQQADQESYSDFGIFPQANSLIQKSEYFIDEDPGEGNGIPVPAFDGMFDSEEESVSFNIDTSALSVGFHTLGIRFMDSNGNWSITRKTIFEIKGENYIVAAEYFVDEDPGEGNGTSITLEIGFGSGKEIDLEIPDIETASLSVGIHTFYLRVKDKNGDWSIARQHKFEIAPPLAITGGEFYLESDPGEGNRNVLSAKDGVFDEGSEELEADFTMPSSISIENLPMLSVRVFDSIGRISEWVNYSLAPAPALLYPENNELIRKNDTAYFSWESEHTYLWDQYILEIDDDFNDAQTPFTPFETQDLSAMIKMELPEDLYSWRISTKDINGFFHWPSDLRQFYVDSPAAPPNLIEPQQNEKFRIGNDLELSWEPIEEAVKYSLKIVGGDDLSQPSLIGDPEDGQITTETVFQINTADWEPGNYICAVRAMGVSPSGYEQSVYEAKIGWGDYATRQITLLPPPGGIIVIPNTIQVYDDDTMSQDITGMTDFDDHDQRKLVITWDENEVNKRIDIAEIKDWHIYAQTDIYGYFYLGRTGSGSDFVFQWPGSRFIDKKQQNGPSFGHTYRFIAYGLRIDGGFVINTQGKPVGYSITDSPEVPIFLVSPPTMPTGTLMVADDLFDKTDLSNGSDEDVVDSSALCLFWNVGVESYWNYHIYLSVNGEKAKFLGQTGSGEINFFRWSNIPLFSTSDEFLNGPSDGESYSFTVYGLTAQGTEKVVPEGPVVYNVHNP